MTLKEWLRNLGTENALKKSIAFFLIIGLLGSRNLWLTSRSYPLIPVFDWIPDASAPIDMILYIAGILIPIWIIFSKHSRFAIIGFLALATFWCLSDQSRLQPWFYQYALMLLAFSFSNPLLACRVALPGVYFWSGIQKLNDTFVREIFPWLIDPFYQHLPEELFHQFDHLAYAIPFIEAAIGIALLFSKTRRIAVVLAITMHAFVLFSIGPLGHNVNNIVWPWNIAMMVFLLLIYWPHSIEKDSFRKLIDRPMFAHVILVAFLILPVLNFVGGWDAYLSFSLYSGNVVEGEVRLTNSKEEFRIYTWSMEEMNVPPNPEARIYKGVFAVLCAQVANPQEFSLEINYPSHWLTSARQSEKYRCADFNPKMKL